MTINTIWFDFGGVLSPPIDELYTVYQRKTGVSRVEMEAAMAEVARPLGVHFLAPIELAMITQREWAKGMREALTRLYPDLDISRCNFDNHGEQWFQDHRVNPGVVELVTEMKEAGFKVGILTNNVIEWEYSWRTMVGLDHLVDLVVDSCKVRMRKPEPRIFALSAERARSQPSECALIDDLDENCAAARACGWEAVVFRDAAQTAAELRQLVGGAVIS
ncbi:HAD family hydrolase [Paraburkholderia lacunae]|uniref:HAD family phosphatase n=1 Tax=Paraburkholderia lacunae TaxID=2211104 RepID=A0A370NAX3_9BURK|nr:HAD family phosphatase [Paraburkholderia lacunae]RDK02742.1 HAD family phosphatase [Paraburkholderia lacunae]